MDLVSAQYPSHLDYEDLEVLRLLDNVILFTFIQHIELT